MLEKTIEGYPAQKKLFQRILDSDLYTANEFPKPSDGERNGPKISKDRHKAPGLWDEVEK